MNIIYDNLPDEMKDLLPLLERAAEETVSREGLSPEPGEVSLSFVSEEEIRELNRTYRDNDSVTDVLSFPQYEDLSEIGEGMPFLLGDVVICGQRAKEQAEDFGHGVDREVVYLFVHSLLHLLGYDHMEEEERKVMRDREETVMECLDLGRD